MSPAELEAFCDDEPERIAGRQGWAEFHDAFLAALESGAVAAAVREPDGRWASVPWVKRGILAGFRAAPVEAFPAWPGGARDKTSFPPRCITPADGVRLVPGGSSIRRGTCLGRGVVVMPPAFINVGAWIGHSSMVDSHVLVGSCAHIGERVHLSAGAQVGGVLEPVGARPVVVEDGAFVGALAALLEGVVVRERAVIAPGTILSAGIAIYDIVNGRVFRGEVPPGAVVVPGSRPASGAYARKAGIRLAAPCIVKYRDGKTEAALALEEALR
ncbi:MAG TPA: 2,3,4,5-tetrahydropyridine-2,6-dicarboxylate N-succinyltransferase [Magnetospirillaceae bacterium]|nr:2,3,4,5-tetrahydropyridine-2,6-dicarboxylate N-succinyltransferase [Magnetospirillaceae bacterium]